MSSCTLTLKEVRLSVVIADTYSREFCTTMAESSISLQPMSLVFTCQEVQMILSLLKQHFAVQLESAGILSLLNPLTTSDTVWHHLTLATLSVDAVCFEDGLCASRKGGCTPLGDSAG